MNRTCTTPELSGCAKTNDRISLYDTDGLYTILIWAASPKSIASVSFVGPAGIYARVHHTHNRSNDRV